MAIAIVLVVGSVVLLVAAFTWVAQRETIERAREIGALRPTPLEDVKERRLTAVRANASAEEAITDPVSGELVAFYEARVARVDGGERVLRTLRGGQVVNLEDGTGHAAVRLEGADLAIGWRELEQTDREPSPLARKLLEEGGVAVPEPDRSARYAIFHRAVRVGDPVTVVGTPAFTDSVTTRAGYRGGASALPRFEARAEGLVVSDADLATLQERERADVRAMSRMLVLAAVIGLALIGIGATLAALG